MLIQAVLLYNCDGIQDAFIRSNSSRFEKIQFQYANLLLKYMKSLTESEKDAYRLFHQGLMMVQATQRLHDLSQNRLILS